MDGYDSGRRITGKYISPESATRYVGVHVGTRHHLRELRCVRHALAGLSAGALVLDIPCGAGRLFPMLAEAGFRIAGADVSPAMVEEARRAVGALQPDARERIAVADASRTGFSAQSFDAVLCNRLFHHLAEPGARRVVLAELARVSRGPVVVSFFDLKSYDACIRRVRGWLLRKPSRRFPILATDLAEDFAAAGLEVKAVHWTWRFISQQAYMVGVAARAR
jgi:SAM-dependent methyltransferase